MTFFAHFLKPHKFVKRNKPEFFVDVNSKNGIELVLRETFDCYYLACKHKKYLLKFEYGDREVIIS